MFIYTFMKVYLNIFMEIILIFASILIFRSLWLLLDNYLGSSWLILFLLIGITLAIIALYFLNKQYNKQKL